MNEAFETLPFAMGEVGEVGEGEQEQDEFGRGGRMGGRGGGRQVGRPSGRPGGRPVARPIYRSGARPGKGPVTRPAPVPGPRPPAGRPRWPRGPYWGPFYGGGGGLTVSEPFGYPVAVAPSTIEPVDFPGPADGGDNGADDRADIGADDRADNGADNSADGGAEGQGELPSTIAATVGRLPAADRPGYLALGPILTARRDPRVTGAGFYLIEFTVDGRQRAYSGQTDNLQRRLQQHILCGTMMGLPLAHHQVYVAPSRMADTRRRAIEYRIHDDMFRHSPGVLTNQRRELELELLGW